MEIIPTNLKFKSPPGTRPATNRVVAALLLSLYMAPCLAAENIADSRWVNSESSAQIGLPDAGVSPDEADRFFGEFGLAVIGSATETALVYAISLAGDVRPSRAAQNITDRGIGDLELFSQFIGVKSWIKASDLTHLRCGQFGMTCLLSLGMQLRVHRVDAIGVLRQPLQVLDAVIGFDAAFMIARPVVFAISDWAGRGSHERFKYEVVDIEEFASPGDLEGYDRISGMIDCTAYNSGATSPASSYRTDAPETGNFIQAIISDNGTPFFDTAYFRVSHFSLLYRLMWSGPHSALAASGRADLVSQIYG